MGTFPRAKIAYPIKAFDALTKTVEVFGEITDLQVS